MFWPSSSPSIPAAFQLMGASKRPQSKIHGAVDVPGGAWNSDQLRANPAVLSFLQKFQATGKPLGALCHGSQVFLSAKLTKGRKATGYWSIMEDMANAGATVLDQPVVVDENVITSRFIYDIPQFVDAIVAQLN